MIQPMMHGLALRAAMLDATQGAHFWWLGQSGFLVRVDGATLLFDPYLSDALTEKYATTDKPHQRMTAIAIDAAQLDFVDVVTSSHNHTDHLDAATLRPLIGANPALKMVAPAANLEFVAQRLGERLPALVGLNDGETVTVAGWEISAVPAAHETLQTDATGRHKFLGFVARRGGLTFYHSGDTVPYPGMAEKLRPFGVDVALLPINGRLPQRRVDGNLWGREAAQLAHDIGARLAVPCHYEMFKFNTETPEEFVAECRRLGQPFRVVRCGEHVTL